MNRPNSSGTSTRTPVPSDIPTPWRPWATSWLGVVALAIVNGGVHRAYEPALGVLRAEQLSNVTLLAAVLPWAVLVDRRHPTSSTQHALEVGATWCLLTVAFEFLSGHYVNGDSWGSLVRAYDVTAGHLWPFTVAGIFLAPVAARTLRRRDVDG